MFTNRKLSIWSNVLGAKENIPSLGAILSVSVLESVWLIESYSEI